MKERCSDPACPCMNTGQIIWRGSMIARANGRDWVNAKWECPTTGPHSVRVQQARHALNDIYSPPRHRAAINISPPPRVYEAKREPQARKPGERTLAFMRLRARGLTYKELGEVFGVSGGRARQMVTKGQQQLKRWQRAYKPPEGRVMDPDDDTQRDKWIVHEVT